MNAAPGPGGLWPQTAERRPRHSISATHNFTMDQVIKLSRREAKPFMGSPNKIRSKSKQNANDPLDDLMGEYLAHPRQNGGMIFNGIPGVTPSPQPPPTLGKKQRERYNELNNKNPVQQKLFEADERVKNIQRNRNVRYNNRRYRMYLDANEFLQDNEMYDLNARAEADQQRQIRFYKRQNGKRSKY